MFYRHHKKPNPKKPVTLIVGIICEDGIVVASDSQTTDMSSGMARTDGSKINITLADGSSGVVATAGSVDWSLQIIERVEQMAKQTVLTSERSFADLVENANIEIKKKERLVGRTSRELQRHFDDYEAEILIANYFRGAPCMYTFLSNGMVSPTRVTKQLYVSIGNSEAMADYLLKKFNLPSTLTGVGHAIALYTINEVIQAKDTFCYYPIQGSHVCPRPPDSDTGESTAMLFDSGDIANELKPVTMASHNIESQLKRGMWAACLAFVEMMEIQSSALQTEIKRLKQELDERQHD
jgi:20S proteasome alpha/beta subunit